MTCHKSEKGARKSQQQGHQKTRKGGGAVTQTKYTYSNIIKAIIPNSKELYLVIGTIYKLHVLNTTNKTTFYEHDQNDRH